MTVPVSSEPAQSTDAEESGPIPLIETKITNDDITGKVASEVYDDGVSTDYVTLKGGHRVPMAVLRLAWDLEARGFTITTDGTLLTIRPKAR